MSRGRRSAKPVLIVVMVVVAGFLGGCTSYEWNGEEGVGEGGGQTDTFNETNVEAEFIAILNEARSERDLPRLSQRDVLTEMGRSHAADMEEHGYTGHEDSAGRTIEDRYRNRGLLPECELPTADGQFYAGAENAAMGYVDRPMDVGWTDGTFEITSDRELAEFLYNGWYNSDGHRRVLFLESASEIGLGIAIGDDNQLYAAMEVC